MSGIIALITCIDRAKFLIVKFLGVDPPTKHKLLSERIFYYKQTVWRKNTGGILMWKEKKWCITLRFPGKQNSFRKVSFDITVQTFYCTENIKEETEFLQISC